MKVVLKNLGTLLLLVYGFSASAGAISNQSAPAQLRYNLDFILQQVLINKNIAFRTDLAIPQVYFESSTSLKQFQDAVEPQWGFRPDVFTNAYSISKNEVYISDDASYYEKLERCMDDSVAHEFTHYVQAKYQNFDLNDESLEWNAVDVQTWFRNTYCH